MSTRIGMDAGVVRQSAVAIASNAADLDRVIGSVNGLVAEIAGTWTGDAAADFHQSWTHRHRPELTALVAALHDYAQQANRNADAQDHASAASGSSVSGGWNAWLGGAALAGPVLLRLMEGAPPDVGRYPKSWEKLLTKAPQAWDSVIKHAPEGFQKKFADLPDEVLRYKRLGVVHDLNDLRGVVHAAGKFAGGVAIASDTYTVVQDARSHDWVSTGLDTGTTAADALKTSKVGYLPGVAVQAWVQVGEAARQVDWSPQGWSEVMHASPSDWASAFGQSVKQMPGRLFKIFG